MVETQKQQKKGSALAVAVVVVLLLTFAGLAMIMIGHYSRVRSIHEKAVDTARCAADTGLKHCIFLMNERIGTTPTPFNTAGMAAITNGGAPRTMPDGSGATYTLALSGSTSAGFLAQSTGAAGTTDRPVTRNVYARLERKTYWWGLGVEGSIDLKNFLVIGTIPGGTSLEVRTNSTDKWAISLNTAVTGDIVFGPDGSVGTVVKLLPGASVSGSIYPAEEKIVFPPVTPPVGLPPMTYVPGVPLQSGVYSSLTINEPNIPTVSGDVTIYVTGKMILGNSAQLKVPATGSLKLYLGTSFEGKNGSALVNETLDATKMRIYGLPTCTSMVIKNSGDFYGAIYAPSADIQIDNNGSIIGSIIAYSLVGMNSGSFLYDMNLADVNDTSAMYMKAVKWWED